MSRRADHLAKHSPELHRGSELPVVPDNWLRQNRNRAAMHELLRFAIMLGASSVGFSIGLDVGARDGSITN